MSTRLATIGLACALLGIGAIAVACGGGGDEAPLEAYFERLEALTARFNERGQDVQTGFDEQIREAESDEDRIAALVDFTEGTAAVFRDFEDELDGLEPPAEVQAAHDAAASASVAVIAVLEDVRDDLEDAETPAEAQAAIDRLLASDAVEQFDETCFDLQAIADENSITVALGCEM